MAVPRTYHKMATARHRDIFRNSIVIYLYVSNVSIYEITGFSFFQGHSLMLYPLHYILYQLHKQPSVNHMSGSPLTLPPWQKPLWVPRPWPLPNSPWPLTSGSGDKAHVICIQVTTTASPEGYVESLATPCIPMTTSMTSKKTFGPVNRENHSRVR